MEEYPTNRRSDDPPTPDSYFLTLRPKLMRNGEISKICVHNCVDKRKLDTEGRAEKPSRKHI
jgi:hypothetical protein